MNNYKIIILLSLLSLTVFSSSMIAQETIPDTTLKSMRLALPCYSKESSHYALDDEIANILSEVAEMIGLWDIIVGINISASQSKSENNFADHKIVDFADLISSYREAVIVNESNIFQTEFETQSDEQFFPLRKNANPPVSKKNKKKYSYYTEISTILYFYNLEHKESLGSLEIIANDSGNTLLQSKYNAMKQLREKLMLELKKIYWLSSEIYANDADDLSISLGSRQGIKKGEIMELIEPDRIWSDEIGDYIISGGNVAFVVIADTTQDSSRVKVLRQWGEYYPESWVVEYPYSIYVLELFYVTPSAESYINVGLSFHARPLSAFDWGFGAQIIRATDSFNQDNYGFGFNGFTLWRFFNSTKLDVAAKFGLDVDFPFKTDDDGHSVNTALLSAQIAFVTEYPVSRNLDFTSNFGYRWGKKTSEWQFSVEDESLSAYWKGDAPVVNNTGFVLSFGFKIYVF